MKLIGDSAIIQINIMGFSNPNSMDEWDQKWLNVEVDIKVSGFAAHFNILLLIDDFTSFKASLEKAIEAQKGEIEFNTLEESVFLKGLITYTGSIEWEGFVMYPVGDGNTLKFKTTSDFNQLESMLREINKDLKKLGKL